MYTAIHLQEKKVSVASLVFCVLTCGSEELRATLTLPVRLSSGETHKI